MEIKFGPEFEESLQRAIWRERLEPINPLQWARKLKWFIQRGQHGYSDRDVWNFNDYLSRIIVGGVRHLKQHHVGYPMTTSFANQN